MPGELVVGNNGLFEGEGGGLRGRHEVFFTCYILGNFSSILKYIRYSLTRFI